MTKDNEEHGRSRRTDPHTSHRAGEHINVNALELIFVQALSGGPLTTFEIAERTGVERISISPRGQPLAEKGMVYRHGTKPCLNASGRIMEMITWALTPKGRAFLGLAPETQPSPSSSPAGAGGPKRPDAPASAQASLPLDDSDR